MGAHRKAGRLLRVFAVPLLPGGVLTGLGSTAASALTCRAWTVVPSPNPGTGSNFLTSINGISPTDIGAVGADSNAEDARLPLQVAPVPGW
ncbi:MAG TPA: hypothetical protein VFQ68_10740 [Streptosporangiaceae bacterium]|nr:hypothetical protein [Streptosporangiaceae bacterium]